jgi:hypothetical protein
LRREMLANGGQVCWQGRAKLEATAKGCAKNAGGPLSPAGRLGQSWSEQQAEYIFETLSISLLRNLQVVSLVADLKGLDPFCTRRTANFAQRGRGRT